METLQEMMERHTKEIRELRAGCLHSIVGIKGVQSGGGSGSERTIIITCELCGALIFSWENGKVCFVKGFRKVEETHQS